MNNRTIIQSHQTFLQTCLQNQCYNWIIQQLTRPFHNLYYRQVSIQAKFEQTASLPLRITLNHIYMLNQITTQIYTKIYDALKAKGQDFLKNKAKYLGIELKQFYKKQRIMFTVSQHITQYMDLHMQQSKSYYLGKECNINEILKKKDGQVQYKSHSVHFNVAVYTYHYFSGNYNIWDSVKVIQEVQRLFQKENQEDITLEVIKDNRQISFLSNQRLFTCICRNQQQQNILRCEKCMRIFHPNCQYQKLVCNKCYMGHYFFPLDTRFLSIFGQKRQITTFFHGNLRTFNEQNEKKAELFFIKFDIEDFVDLQRATEPQIFIKMINFKDLSTLTHRFEKWRNLTAKTNESSFFLNENKLEFYLNFTPLKRKNLMFRNENSLIFKLENRLPNQKNNILMVKCDPGFLQDQQYEIGVYRVRRIKRQKAPSAQEDGQFQKQRVQFEPDQSNRVTQEQFKNLVKYGQSLKKSIKSQNQKVKQAQDGDHEKQLVRSYGCNHQEGLNLAQLKREHKQLIDKYNLNSKNKVKKSDTEKMIKNEIKKLYKTHLLSLNIKREEEICIGQNGFRNIKKYCQQNNLLKRIKIPQVQKYDKSILKSCLQRYGIKYQHLGNQIEKKGSHHMKNRNELLKEQKKYMKFVKCPICSNQVSALYLLPFELKEGQSLKDRQNCRAIRERKRKRIIQQQAKQSLLESFNPKQSAISLIFPHRKKKYEQYEDQSEQAPLKIESGLLISQQHRQIQAKVLKQQSIYCLAEYKKEAPNKEALFCNITVQSPPRKIKIRPVGFRPNEVYNLEQDELQNVQLNAAINEEKPQQIYIISDKQVQSGQQEDLYDQIAF